MDRLAVAFSGGVDSTLLLKLLKDILGKENILAVTAVSEFSARAEIIDARRIAKSLGVKHVVIKVRLLNDPRIKSNPSQRCYYCKKKIFGLIKREAAARGFGLVVDASNYDDIKDYRPGIRALKEMGIRSPLKDAKLTKKDIRRLSKKLDLPTWDKPANACLATRLPYGEPITARKLRAVEVAEGLLRRTLKLKLIRVRKHGDTARIEVLPAEMKKFVRLREAVIKKLNSLGFRHITLDLKGYRTGSMNP